MKKKLFLVVGRTNSGKDTLTNKMSDYYHIPVIVSCTDRPMRFHETDGKEHTFFTKTQMDRLLDTHEVLAYTKIENPKTHKEGFRYCVTKKYVDRLKGNSAFYIIDPNGLSYLKEHFGDDYDLTVISIMAPEETRRRRSMARKDTDFETRMANENDQFNLFENNLNNYDYQIRNDGALEDAMLAFHGIMKREL